MDAVADSLRHLLELGTQHRPLLEVLANAAGILTAIAGAITAAFFAFRWLARKLRNGKPSDPDLSDPPLADGSLTRYSARAVELLGRDEAMARLQAFLLADGGSLWMQIAGVGGQGKSRLGWELILAARDDGWQAGLLERCDLDAFAAHWASWRPRRPHLLVLDYVIGREAAIKPVLQTLAGRAAALRKPVRLLLLERQRWDRGGLGGLARGGDAGTGLSPGFGFDGRAEWFLRLAERPDGNDPRLEITRFEDGLLELTRLSDADLVAIVRRIAGLAGAEIALTDDAIAEQLRHIDSDGRPLYAYFLGQALADGADPGNGGSGPGWRREDLLNATLERDRNTRWRECLGEDAPCLGDNSPPERLAVIATIAGGLDCRTAARAGLIPHADAETRRRALVLADGPLGTGVAGPSQVIPPLMPDLLGAWLVLSACEQGLPPAELLDIAWRHAPEQTAAFLQRISQDFPEHYFVTELLDRQPPNGPSKLAFARVCPAIHGNLHRARRPFPAQVISSLMKSANAGDPTAMVALGFSFQVGGGIEQDEERAVHWYREAAIAEDSGAMVMLSICYESGLGVEKDDDQAYDLVRRAAEARLPAAMGRLGRYLHEGIGVEIDLAQALSWYEKAAAAGDGFAMNSLGICFERGQGFERDSRKAVEWYKKGAQAGNDAAMVNFARCCADGLGIDRDIGQALKWNRTAAQQGNGQAMVNLGWCYAEGHGVQRDLSQAVIWYQKGTKVGNAQAMTNLGACYAMGRGVERNPEMAVSWYRKGVSSGNPRGNRSDPLSCAVC